MDIQDMIPESMKGKTVKEVNFHKYYVTIEFEEVYILKIGTALNHAVIEYQYTTVEAMARGIPND